MDKIKELIKQLHKEACSALCWEGNERVYWNLTLKANEIERQFSLPSYWQDPPLGSRVF